MECSPRINAIIFAFDRCLLMLNYIRVLECFAQLLRMLFHHIQVAHSRFLIEPGTCLSRPVVYVINALVLLP